MRGCVVWCIWCGAVYGCYILCRVYGVIVCVWHSVSGWVMYVHVYVCTMCIHTCIYTCTLLPEGWCGCGHYQISVRFLESYGTKEKIWWYSTSSCNIQFFAKQIPLTHLVVSSERQDSQGNSSLEADVYTFWWSCSLVALWSLECHHQWLSEGRQFKTSWQTILKWLIIFPASYMHVWVIATARWERYWPMHSLYTYS